MKNIITVVLLITTMSAFAQAKKTKEVKFKTTSLVFSVDSSDELKTINWDEAKDFFKDSDEDEEISIGFKVKKGDSRNTKLNIKESMVLNGKVAHIDKFIKILSDYKPKNTNEVKKSALVFTVDSIKELKEIDWKEAQEFFEGNDEDDEVILGCKVRRSKEEKSKLTIKQSYQVSGKFKDLDKLIKIMSKYTKSQKE